jgi:autophagy-related protein 5
MSNLIDHHSLIPIRIELSNDSLSSPTSPPPLFMQVPRWGYLSSILSSIWPYYHASVALASEGISERGWFSSDSTPLLSNLPIGVLYDTLVGLSPSHDPGIIWELDLHYSSPPADHCNTVDWISKQSMQTIFFSSLKEASFIIRGPDGPSNVMRMTAAAQEQLWQSVCSSDSQRLRSSSLKLAQSSERQASPLLIPIRLIASTSSNISHMTSRPWPAKREDGSFSTLGDLLTALLIAPSQGSSQGLSPQQEGDAIRASRCLVFGIQPPLESPLLWLHREFHYGDSFLYISALCDPSSM